MLNRAASTTLRVEGPAAPAPVVNYRSVQSYDTGQPMPIDQWVVGEAS